MMSKDIFDAMNYWLSENNFNFEGSNRGIWENKGLPPKSTSYSSGIDSEERFKKLDKLISRMGGFIDVPHEIIKE